MTFLLALFLALGKRRDDVLLSMSSGERARRSIGGYTVDSHRQQHGGARGGNVIVSYIMYTMSTEIIVSQFKTGHLYLTTVFVILGIMRYSDHPRGEAFCRSCRDTLKDSFIQIALIGWITIPVSNDSSVTGSCWPLRVLSIPRRNVPEVFRVSSKCGSFQGLGEVLAASRSWDPLRRQSFPGKSTPSVHCTCTVSPVRKRRGSSCNPAAGNRAGRGCRGLRRRPAESRGPAENRVSPSSRPASRPTRRRGC